MEMDKTFAWEKTSYGTGWELRGHTAKVFQLPVTDQAREPGQSGFPEAPSAPFPATFPTSDTGKLPFPGQGLRQADE